jgi:hypothetical protein
VYKYCYYTNTYSSETQEASSKCSVLENNDLKPTTTKKTGIMSVTSVMNYLLVYMSHLSGNLINWNWMIYCKPSFCFPCILLGKQNKIQREGCPDWKNLIRHMENNKN